MPDETTPAVQPVPTAPVAPSTQAVSDLPAWAQTVLSEARGEAASWRTKFRAAEADLTVRETEAAELKTKLEAASAFEVAANEGAITVAKMRAALLAGVKPDADLTGFAAFTNALQGDNEEALKAHAASLLALAASSTGNQGPRPDRSQGSTNPVQLGDGSAKGILNAMFGNTK